MLFDDGLGGVRASKSRAPRKEEKENHATEGKKWERKGK